MISQLKQTQSVIKVLGNVFFVVGVSPLLPCIAVMWLFSFLDEEPIEEEQEPSLATRECRRCNSELEIASSTFVMVS